MSKAPESVDAASIASTAAPDAQTNIIRLVSADVSTIASVSLYGSRAEITRVAKFDLQAGQNRVTITGLPGVMVEKTLRVEGRGSTTIHDVTTSDTPSDPDPQKSPELQFLEKEKQGIEFARSRVSKRLEALEHFITTLNAKDNSIAQVAEALSGYEREATALQEQSYELERKASELDKSIREATHSFWTKDGSDKLSKQLTVAIYAREEGSIELVLIYAVYEASWRAAYDTRVMTASVKGDETPVDLTYKALINQSTGQDWNDVPIVLETASPTFGLSIPQLSPHTLRVYKPPIQQHSPAALLQSFYTPLVSETANASSFRGNTSMAAAPPMMKRARARVIHQEAVVTSAGGITATFSIPGRSNIPSDGEDHQVTIAKLKLEARLQWVAVPSVSLQTRLKANIKNASEYTFLPGETSVYLDGSFISNSPVPPVSPEESFDCPLGVDSSIRLTYHPRTTKSSQTGFYTKTQIHAYAQRITVFNTRTRAVENVTVLAQVPVSQDSAITVRIVKPALPPPASTSSPGAITAAATVSSAQNQAGPSSSGGSGSPGGSGSGGASGASAEKGIVRVSSSAVAEWEDAREGRLKWTVKVAPQEKLMLELEWEVSAPAGTSIVGL
ncbi:hypothetical protein BOTBODRAFT_35378 [Botryobasidium botryosum FD-172 SS1]|uniref:Mucoidy inhibitor A n=1 Tax=Botryobasidium botryosum (strain FD-172 SS1) TaxID=930990 RepID=A0A067M7H1_BOTB1|nr:hypothetical protein BOTBODRAFT_35378 [Botryobasidium botryosum FD-172 SS1]